jgi:hypothetical protein
MTRSETKGALVSIFSLLVQYPVFQKNNKNLLKTANVQEHSLSFDNTDIRVYTLVYINYTFVIGEEIKIWKEW